MLGSIVTIRRNVRILHDSQQVCEQRNEEMLANQTKIMDQLTRMESQMERLAFNIDMTSIDISGYFPIRNNEMIYAFLSNEDGTLEEKKKTVWVHDVHVRNDPQNHEKSIRRIS